MLAPGSALAQASGFPLPTGSAELPTLLRMVPSAPPPCGLLLTGGGARAAYQVGVLEAIADLKRASDAGPSNPFSIITGTSAGAINAAALACGSDDFDAAVRRMVAVWEAFRADQVYRADYLSVAQSGARWLTLLSLGWVLAKFRRMRPRSLLDNSPLRDLLADMVPLHRLPGLIEAGHVRALAVTASSYSSGQHVTFFQGDAHLQAWTRSQRIAARDTISHEHLLASAAIPFVFPAMPLDLQGRREFFGDGSMRQSAPIAAAIHLGAERIVVVGAGRMHEPTAVGGLTSAAAGLAEGTAPGPASGTPLDAYPSLAQIAGHALSNIFLDALSVDVERVQRINQTLRLVPPESRQHSTLRPVELLVISPSQRLDAAAARHIESMPNAVLTMLGALGVRRSNSADFKGAALASYLLFEQAYTQELMGLGYGDTWARREEVLDFFGWTLQHEPLGNPERQDAWTATQM